MKIQIIIGVALFVLCTSLFCGCLGSEVQDAGDGVTLTHVLTDENGVVYRVGGIDSGNQPIITNVIISFSWGKDVWTDADMSLSEKKTIDGDDNYMLLTNLNPIEGASIVDNDDDSKLSNGDYVVIVRDGQSGAITIKLTSSTRAEGDPIEGYASTYVGE